MDIMKSAPLLLLFAAFFIGLGAYALKTGVLVTGGRGMGIRRTKTVLAYPFGALFVVVGGLAIYHAAVLILDQRSFVAACNDRATTRQCVEYHEGSAACAAPSSERCPTDNLVGRCELSNPRRVELIYSDMWERKPEVEQPRCTAAGGTWSGR